MLEEEKKMVASAVATVLGFPSWVKYVTSRGDLKKRLTEFVVRVLKELQPEADKQVEALVAARDDALKQVEALEDELDSRFRRQERERFPADVWDIVIAIWKELREKMRVFVPERLDIEPKRKMAAAYIEAGGGEDAAYAVGKEEMNRLIAEGKTKPWDEREDPDPEQNRRRCIELFERARRARCVFTVGTVEVDGESVGTLDYAIGKIVPVLKEQGETAAYQAACDLVVELADGKKDSPRTKPKPESTTPAPGAAKVTTVTTAPPKKSDNLADELKPLPPENGNGFGEMFLAKTAEKVGARGETPVTIVFKADVAVRLIRASYDSLEKMVAETSTPKVDGWVSLVRAAQECLDAAAAKQQEKQTKHDEESFARKIERVRAAFIDELTDNDVRALIAIRVSKPNDLDGKDLAYLAKEMAKALPAGQGKAYARQLLDKLAAVPL